MRNTNFCTFGLPPSSAIGLNSLLADLCTYLKVLSEGSQFGRFHSPQILYHFFQYFCVNSLDFLALDAPLALLLQLHLSREGLKNWILQSPRAIHHASYLDFGCFLTDGKMLTKSRGRADRHSHVRNRNRG